MAAWLMNLGFAAGTAVVAATPIVSRYAVVEFQITRPQVTEFQVALGDVVEFQVVRGDTIEF